MTQRDRIVLSVLVGVALLAGFWFVAIKPKRAEVSRLSAEIAKTHERRDAANARVATGENARRRYTEDYATVATLGKAVPVGDQTPSLIYQLDAAADRHDVNFSLFKTKASGTAAASTPAAPTSGAKGVPAQQAAAAVAPPGSTVGPAGFPTMPFAFRFEGDFFRLERFLSELERFTSTTGDGESVNVRGRLITIDGVALKAGPGGFPDIEANLAATAYVLKPGESLTGGATPSGPTAGATTTTAGAKPAPGGATTPPTTATVRGVTP